MKDEVRLPDWVERLGPRITSLDDPVAEQLLPPLRECLVDLGGDSFVGIWIKHPWVNMMLPFVGQANDMYTAKFSMARQYLVERNFFGYLFVVCERPWRYEILANWWERDKLTIDELRELLPSVWTDTE